MKIIIYDKKPGEGVGQWFLMLTWLVGSYCQKLLGAADRVYGAESWSDALNWLSTLQDNSITSLQYWGHGSPGYVWLNSKPLILSNLVELKNKFVPQALVWFRTCSTFQGLRGHQFSKYLADNLNCVVAGHTRVIGLLQGGLHTRQSNTQASWPLEEGEPKSSLPSYLVWGPNTITCFQTKIPHGW